jgi:hypothetical protein
MSLCQDAKNRMVSFSDGLNPAGRQIPYGYAGNPVRAAARLSPCPNGNGMLRTQNLIRGCFETNTSKPESQCSRATKSAHQETSHMKRNLFIALILAGAASFAAAQMQNPTSDVLGAHLNYGRGCAACHAPHSGAYGNGAQKGFDGGAGAEALWGEDVGSLYGKTIVTGQSEHGSYTEVLPTSLTAGTPDVSGILMCLSCHDGNYASGAMMQNKVYETLPASYGTNNSIPTLLGKDNTGGGNYLNDHPVGPQATIGCGGAYNWDCTINSTGGIVPGPKMTQFITNYGFFVSPGVMNNQPVVLCTTCHNQHLMNVVKVTTGAIITDSTKSTYGTLSGGNTLGLPAGNYATMFFIRAPYNPASATTGSNQTAQFCRQCHGGEANEMNGGASIATTF